MAHLSRVEIYELQSKVQQKRLDLLQNKNLKLDGIFDFIKMVELLNSEVRKLRLTTSTNDPLLVSAEDTLSLSAQSVLLTARSENTESYSKTLIEQYRRVWRENFSLFLFTSALFLISTLIGYAMTLSVPDYSSLFIGQSMIENIMDQKAWFERIQKNPLFYGFEIAFNNIRVSLMAFTLGAIAGLGGIYILVVNGLMLGSIVALCQIYGFEDALLTFISGHGPLELTLIIAAVFGSFVFGRTFYERPWSEIGVKMKNNAKDALYILYGVVLWLCFAAVIEVGISPWPLFSEKTKIVIGILAAAIFWYWTFKPEKLKS